MIKVSFTSEDMERVLAFVDEIKAVKPNVRRTELTDIQRDDGEVAGKLGEVAFAKHFGWPVDWEVRLGGDNYDFLLANGDTVDVKAVSVKRNMDHDYSIPIGVGESPATFYVQVLIAPGYSSGLITGGISKRRFMQISCEEKGWEHRGEVIPLVVKRSQLSQEWPKQFYQNAIEEAE